jgi:hypothetical protein
MIDITTTRAMALHMHPPRIIYALLFGLALSARSWQVIGWRRAKIVAAPHPWLHGYYGYSCVILDIEYGAQA